MKNKALIVILAIFTATALSSVFGVRIAFANPSQAHMTCQGGLYYEAHDYPRDGSSTVTAYIDGKRLQGFPKSFGPSIEGTVPNPDKTKPHTWKVVWDGSDGSKGDRKQEGSVDSCVTPPTSPSTTTSTSSTTTTTTVLPSTVPMAEESTTTVLTDIDTPPVPTTTNPPTATTNTVQPPTPPNGPGLPDTGIEISTFGWGLILITAGILILVWNRRSLKNRDQR